MRALTAKQKKVIDRFMLAHPDARGWDDLDLETMDELEAINITEVLQTNTDHYMHDKVWAGINKR